MATTSAVLAPSPITAALGGPIQTSWGILGPSGASGVDVKRDPLSSTDLSGQSAMEDPVNMLQMPTFAPAGGGLPNDLVDLNDLFGDDFLSPDITHELLLQGDDDDDEFADEGPMSSLPHEPEPETPPLKPEMGSRDTRQNLRMVQQDSLHSVSSDVEDDGSFDKGRKRKKAKLTLKPLTEAQRIERRERNREHAKRSRMRKKFMLESLQAQMLALRKENLRLRQVVTSKMPESADKILSTCSALRSTARLSQVELGHHTPLVDSDHRLIKSLQFSQQNFTISDPSLPDNPIVYASEGFLRLTGYRLDQVLGRNCRFLQGPGTDPLAVDLIRKGITHGDDVSVCLLNYRADGTPFWNQFFVAALRDSDGHIVNYVGVQCEVQETHMEDELKERVKTLNFADYDDE